MSDGRIDELLEAERRRPGFSSAQRAELWRRIATAIGVTDAAESGATDGSSEASPARGADAARHTAQQAATSIGAGKLGALLTLVALGGAAVGAVAHALWAPPRVVTVERVAPSSAAPIASAFAPPTASVVSTTPAVSASAPPAARLPSTPRTVPSAASAPPAASRDANLARERSLLEMARTALTRNDPAAALSALDSHARDYPASPLAEEREVMAIQALASAHRLPEARRRAAAFRARFANSPLMPIVEEVTQ